MLLYMLCAWAAVTVILFGLLLYRSRITLNEDDQIFLDGAEDHLAEEQREIVAKAERLTKPIHVFGWVSGLLALAVAALWVQDIMSRF